MRDQDQVSQYPVEHERRLLDGPRSILALQVQLVRDDGWAPFTPVVLAESTAYIIWLDPYVPVGSVDLGTLMSWARRPIGHTRCGAGSRLADRRGCGRCGGYRRALRLYRPKILRIWSRSGGDALVIQPSAFQSHQRSP